MERHPGLPVIEVKGLTKRFGGLTAVKDLSFSIQQGEVFGFLGPNGAGKTTTIQMICGISPPTSGEIRIAGIQQGKMRQHFGLCPQENIIWPKLTCMEQLEFSAGIHGISRRPARARSAELLGLMGLANKANVLAGKLSGGMKRRLNLCLALIHDPSILLLDEPEAGLDPQSRVLVRDYIRSLAGSKTVLLTTHNMDEADRLSDRVAIIDQGCLLMLDSPENLKKTTGAGDVMEIRVGEGIPEKAGDLQEKLERMAGEVRMMDSLITVRARNLVGAIPEITAILNGAGCRIMEITLRENTLEDVFIHLTGRQLRQ